MIDQHITRDEAMAELDDLARRASLATAPAAEAASPPAGADLAPANEPGPARSKGRLRVHGLDLSIETPRGEKRRGTRPDGSTWEATAAADYGSIRRTEGADGEAVDVYVGPHADVRSARVRGDQQRVDGTGFDEHKVLLGFESRETAERAYHSPAISAGRAPARPVRTFENAEAFRSWQSADTSQPASISGITDDASSTRSATTVEAPASGAASGGRLDDFMQRWSRRMAMEDQGQAIRRHGRPWRATGRRRARSAATYPSSTGGPAPL